MVVGRRHRHHLRDAELDEAGGTRVGEPGRPRDRAGRDDRPLAGHQARHRCHRADPTGVGERDVRALHVVGRETAVACLADEVLVDLPEAREVERVGLLDDGHDQRPPAVLALHVDGQPEVHVRRNDPLGLAVVLLEGVAHRRVGLPGLRDRVSDQMREGHLHLPLRGLERVVQLAAAPIERRDRKRAEAGRGRDLAARLHVTGERGVGAADRLDLRRGGRGRRGRRGGAVAARRCRLHIPARRPSRCGRPCRCRSPARGRSHAPPRRAARPVCSAHRLPRPPSRWR